MPSLPPTLTGAIARVCGVHLRQLHRWRDEGVVVRRSPGFRRADAPPASCPDLLAVAYRAPRAVVCCTFAATAHDLTDALPVAVQIAVPTRDRPPRGSHCAARRYLRRRDVRPASLLRLAAALDVRRPLQRALDVALTERRSRRAGFED